MGNAHLGAVSDALARRPNAGFDLVAVAPGQGDTARVAVTHAEPGTEIEIGQLDGQQKRLKARVVPYPHFDPTKERVKGNYTEA